MLSSTPASSKGRTKLREAHRIVAISVLEWIPFRHPPPRSLFGPESPGEGKSLSHSNLSSSKTIHSGNLRVYKPWIEIISSFIIFLSYPLRREGDHFTFFWFKLNLITVHFTTYSGCSFIFYLSFSFFVYHPCDVQKMVQV